jgi:hypothetical protein
LFEARGDEHREDAFLPLIFVSHPRLRGGEKGSGKRLTGTRRRQRKEKRRLDEPAFRVARS